MKKKEIKSVPLICDAFLPVMDGVITTMLNYQITFTNEYKIYTPVIAPKQKNFNYQAYKYPILTLPSLPPSNKNVGYRVGLPISLKAIKILKKNPPQLIHVHSPFAGMCYGIILRNIFKCPVIYTYHTKYHLELRNRIKRNRDYKISNGFIMKLINSADEVWVVNKPVEKDLRSCGYKGKTITMLNGTDLPNKMLDDNIVNKYTSKYVNKDGRLILLFVGRHIWLKGFKITLDALAKLKKDNVKFTFITIGNGEEYEEIKQYTKDIGLTNDEVKFLGPKTNKEELQAFYQSADLFLLPSVFDCCPLVVLEAAASKTASVLIKGSDAASNSIDRKNAFLIEENSESMYSLLKELNSNRELIKTVSEGASNDLYISKDQSIKKAFDRYKVVANSPLKKHKLNLVTFILKIVTFFLRFFSLFVIVKKNKKN